MFQIIGIVMLFGMVFGSYLLAGGKMAVILHSLPFELMGILGSGVAAFLIANSMDVIKATLGGFGKIFGGAKWKKQDYKDLLSLLFQLTKTMKSKGVVALESHIEKPKESTIFQKYPKVLKDHFAVDFICDTLRMMTMNLEDPHQVEDAMEKQLEKHHHEAQAGAHALQNMADALPALGIVIAVLGVIKTMGSIDQPATILGGMIGGALVGTFLGVLLSYCFVGPLASKLLEVVDSEAKPFHIAKTAIVGYAQGLPVQVAVEIARRMTPSAYSPTFQELESALDEAKDELQAVPA